MHSSTLRPRKLLAHDASGGAARSVHYCSHQNSSLTGEFRPLWGDVELSLPWADRASSLFMLQRGPYGPYGLVVGGSHLQLQVQGWEPGSPVAHDWLPSSHDGALQSSS